MEPADEELLARYGHHPAPPAEGEAAVPEGREPASVVGEPSDEDVLRVAAHALDYVIGPPWNFEAVPMSADDVLTIARAVLARYGHQPAPPAEGERLPSDQEIADVFSQGCRDLSRSHEPPFLGGARAILARWGRPAPVPAPATEGEVGELVEWLKSLEGASIWFEPGSPEDRNRNRAADLLSQRHPTPVPAAERLPEPADCDDEGTCWAWNRTAYTWGLFRLDLTAHSHWLPATALPLPAVEVQP